MSGKVASFPGYPQKAGEEPGNEAVHCATKKPRFHVPLPTFQSYITHQKAEEEPENEGRSVFWTQTLLKYTKIWCTQRLYVKTVRTVHKMSTTCMGVYKCVYACLSVMNMCLNKYPHSQAILKWLGTRPVHYVTKKPRPYVPLPAFQSYITQN